MFINNYYILFKSSFTRYVCTLISHTCRIISHVTKFTYTFKIINFSRMFSMDEIKKCVYLDLKKFFIINLHKNFNILYHNNQIVKMDWRPINNSRQSWITTSERQLSLRKKIFSILT